jgi:integrase
MKIHTITHRARRDGRPVKTYKIRYEEIVRDPATGRPTGAKRSRSETFPTHDAADTRRREIEAERAGTGQVTSRDARLEPFATFAALWVGEARDAVALGDLKARSVADREGTLRRYILPAFAARPVGSITRTDAREFRSALIARGLAPATVKGAFDAFRRVLDLAVDNGVIVVNPAILRRKPGGNRTRHAAGFEHRPLTKAQLGAVVAAARDDLDALVILFLAYTGVRAAELAGLNIGDVRRGTVSVGRTRKRTSAGWTEDTPKSAKSTRRIPLPRWLADRLADYLAEHPRAAEPTAPLSPGGIRAATPTASATRKPGRPAPPTGGNRSSRACSTRTSSSPRSGRPGCPPANRARSAYGCTIFATRSRRWRWTTATTVARSPSGSATPTTPRRSASTRTGSRTPVRTTCLPRRSRPHPPTMWCRFSGGRPEPAPTPPQ